MNERNVAALAGLIAEYRAQHTAADGPGDPSASEGEWTDGLAAFLAARGVVVPSSLTYEQALEVSQDIHPVMTDSYKRDYADEMCANLERVAKGEDAR